MVKRLTIRRPDLLHQEGGNVSVGRVLGDCTQSHWVRTVEGKGWVAGADCRSYFWKCLVNARPALPRGWEVEGIEIEIPGEWWV